MKKVMKNITIVTMCLLFLIGLVLVKNDNNTMEHLSYSNYTKVNPDNLNEAVFKKVDKVYAHAVEFLKTHSGASAQELTMQYIRMEKYTTYYWNSLLNPTSLTIFQEFQDYVKAKDSTLTFSASDNLTDEATHRKIDFVHMIVALLTYTKYDKIGSITYPSAMGNVTFDSNYAGWAGDLVTILEEIIEYRKTNTSATADDIRKQANLLIATNGDSTMNAGDSLANLDAVNLYTRLKKETDFMAVLRSYYKDNSGSGNNSLNRLKTFRTTISTSESNLTQYATELLKLDKMKISGLMNNAANANLINAADIPIVAEEFAAYAYGKAYVSFNETSGSTKVGTKIKLNLVEKNATETATYKYDKNVVNVVVRNSIMYLEPVNKGTTTVEVYNGNELLDSYTISVTNVAPGITKDLVVNYNLVQGLKNTVGFTASGTNNVYTWYIADTEDGEYTKYDTTTKATLKFIPTMEMNGKYMKCGIKNDGHDEIFTKAFQLKVVDKGVVHTGDTSLFIAGGIIVLVVIANLVFELKRKKIKA